MTIVLKLVLAPALVVASSLAGRRWGQQVAGMLVALPIVAGPILLITCLERGARFGSRAAGAALLGLVSLAWFTLIFAWLSRRLGWIATLLISWAGCLLLDIALSRLPLGPQWSLAVVLVVAWVAVPIATSVVAAFALAQLGSPGAVRVLYGIPRGLLGFSVFCFLVAVVDVPLGTGAAFGIASAATLAIQTAWQAVTARLPRPADPPTEPLDAPAQHR